MYTKFITDYKEASFVDTISNIGDNIIKIKFLQIFEIHI